MGLLGRWSRWVEAEVGGERVRGAAFPKPWPMLGVAESRGHAQPGVTIWIGKGLGRLIVCVGGREELSPHALPVLAGREKGTGRVRRGVWIVVQRFETPERGRQIGAECTACWLP